MLPSRTIFFLCSCSTGDLSKICGLLILLKNNIFLTGFSMASRSPGNKNNLIYIKFRRFNNGLLPSSGYNIRIQHIFRWTIHFNGVHQIPENWADRLYIFGLIKFGVQVKIINLNFSNVKISEELRLKIDKSHTILTHLVIFCVSPSRERIERGEYEKVLIGRICMESLKIKRNQRGV